MKLIIAGSRTFDDYKLLGKEAREFIRQNKEAIARVIIASGGAMGADRHGERFAKIHNYNIKFFNADWSKHGKAAGPIRNQEMGDWGTHLLAFWDGVSRGTKHMIEYAKKRGLKVKVILFAPPQ